MKAILKTKELAMNWLNDNGATNIRKSSTRCACGETEAYFAESLKDETLIAGVCEACGDDQNEGDFIHTDRR